MRIHILHGPSLAHILHRMHTQMHIQMHIQPPAIHIQRHHKYQPLHYNKAKLFRTQQLHKAATI